jgi:type II secretory pathway pseudopilin PulG
MELAIAVAIVAILSALLAPFIFSLMEQSRISQAEASLQELSTSLKRVYSDSGYWPYENTVWSPVPNYTYPQIEPRPYNSSDTAMLGGVPPVPSGYPALQPCAQVEPGLPCWNGPYVGGDPSSLGAKKDPWGNPYYYTYLRPSDGWGGGVSSAPNGAVVIWSTGPDGIDQTGCSTGVCSINYNMIAQGMSSLPFCSAAGANPASCSDDIVVFVSPSSQ